MKLLLKPLMLILLLGSFSLFTITPQESAVSETKNEIKSSYWLLLHRKSNIEFLYKGVPGDIQNSVLIETFNVKSGIPKKRPTPLPKLVGREYWVVTEKQEEDNPETSPYFLTLDIPVSAEKPYGPTPYLECDGQCDWEILGFFGLHGSGGNKDKLSKDDPGSSGCVRHSDEDITFLYNILDLDEQEVRYYIEDQ